MFAAVERKVLFRILERLEELMSDQDTLNSQVSIIEAQVAALNSAVDAIETGIANLQAAHPAIDFGGLNQAVTDLTAAVSGATAVAPPAA